MYVAQLTLVALLASRLPLLSVVCKKKTFAIKFPNSSENWNFSFESERLHMHHTFQFHCYLAKSLHVFGKSAHFTTRAMR